MHLHGQLVVRKQKLRQQGKAVGLARRLAYQFPAVAFGQRTQFLTGEWSIGHAALIPGQPGLSNFLVELLVRVDGRQIHRPPRTRAEFRHQQKWVELRHAHARRQSPQPPAT